MSKVFGLGSNGRVDNCSTAPTHPTRRSSVKSPKEIFEEFGPRLVACILGPSASRERIRPLGNRVRSDHGATNDAARNWLKNSHKRAKSRISLSMLMRCARFIRRMWRRRAHRDNLKCIPSDVRAAQTARAPATGREAERLKYGARTMRTAPCVWGNAPSTSRMRALCPCPIGCPIGRCAHRRDVLL